MRLTRTATVVATGCALAVAATMPATALTHHHSAPARPAIKLFKSTIKPDKNVKTGHTLKMTGKGADPNTDYNCLLLVTHGTKKGATYGADLNSIKTVKSNGAGKVVCKQLFSAYKVTDTKGATRHCPLSKKDAKAGFDCAMGLSTSDNSSGSIKTFKAKKSK
jgi:hypothetical protein